MNKMLENEKRICMMCGSDGKGVELFPLMNEGELIGVCRTCQINRNIPPNKFAQMIASKIDDETVSNKQFRKLVRDNLAMVQYRNPFVHIRTVVSFEPDEPEAEEEMEVIQSWHCPVCKYGTGKIKDDGLCNTCHGDMIEGDLPLFPEEEEAEFQTVKVDVETEEELDMTDEESEIIEEELEEELEDITDEQG